MQHVRLIKCLPRRLSVSDMINVNGHTTVRRMGNLGCGQSHDLPLGCGDNVNIEGRAEVMYVTRGDLNGLRDSHTFVTVAHVVVGQMTIRWMLIATQ